VSGHIRSGESGIRSFSIESFHVSDRIRSNRAGYRIILSCIGSGGFNFLRREYADFFINNKINFQKYQYNSGYEFFMDIIITSLTNTSYPFWYVFVKDVSNFDHDTFNEDVLNHFFLHSSMLC
jgi:hypothetical protein